MQSNQKTMVKWFHHSDSTDRVRPFKFIFWTFEQTIDAFYMCRPIIYVNGTHLRSEYNVKLLVAVSQDANDKIILIAYAIVDE